MEILLIAALGLVSGSFITMASYRYAVENEKFKKLLLERSACIKCGHILGVKNLIPIFSWIFQKGKCAFCQKKISIRYPIIEFFCALTFLLIYLALGQIIDEKLVIILAINIILLIMIITDLEHYFIPNSSQIILLILGIFYHIFTKNDPDFLHFTLSALAFVTFGLILYYGFLIITKKQAIGVDDIKFFAVAGFIVGINNFTFFMMLNGFIGIIFGLVWKKITKDDVFPFAPALCISLMITMIYGKFFLNILGLK